MQQARKSDEDIMTIVNTKATEWEGLLHKKEEELRESRRRVGELEQQLRVASASSDKRTAAKLSKVRNHLTSNALYVDTTITVYVRVCVFVCVHVGSGLPLYY